MSKWWKFGFGTKEVAPPVSPARAAHMRRSYAAAATNRLVSGWLATSASVDAEVKGAIKILRNRARSLVRDNDYARSILRTFENNIVGEGIVLQSQVRLQRGGGLDEVTNQAIEDAWELWKEAANCHTAGTNSFNEIEQLIVRSVVESGEVFIRMVYQPFGESKVPFALEVLEADLLDDDYNGIEPNGNAVRMGVEMDQWRRPVAYHFFSQHPGDHNIPSINSLRGQYRQRVPASEVIHMMKPDRPNQTRGASWLASTIMRLHQMAGWEEAEVIGKRVAASSMGFIETDDDNPIADEIYDGELVTDAAPGTFKTLPPGARMHVPAISNGSGDFDPFSRAMLRGCSAGVGASYESISRDYSQSSYSASRQALLEDRDNWRVLQNWMIARFHSRVFKEWMKYAVLSGVLKLKNFELMPERFCKPRWLPRGWSWVDPMKEIDAANQAVRSGFKTQAQIIAESGGDYEEIMATRKREIDRAKEMGLKFDSDPAQDPPKNGLPPSGSKPPGAGKAKPAGDSETDDSAA